jgi:hypothetical protein
MSNRPEHLDPPAAAAAGSGPITLNTGTTAPRAFPYMRSDGIELLATALAKAQGAIKPAIKDRSNDHFGSSYATLASVWDACRAPLSENGLSVAQLPSMDNSVVVVTTILMHTSGQWMGSKLSTLVARPDSQGVGSAVTYLRRFALAAMVGIAPDDDDAEGAVAHPNEPRQRQAPAQRGGRQQAPAQQQRQQRSENKSDKAPPNLEQALRQMNATKDREALKGVMAVLRDLEWTPEEKKTINGAKEALLKGFTAAEKKPAPAPASGPCEACGQKNGRHDKGCPNEERQPGAEG